MRIRPIEATLVEGVWWIKMPRGLTTRVDDSDWGLVRKFTWYGHKHRGIWYAETTKPRDPLTGKYQVVAMHTLLFPDAPTVDHKDGDTLNNCRYNLRPATQGQQLFNRRKSIGFSSKFKGVCWHGQHKSWYASISFEHRRRFLGLFQFEVDAAKAYDEAAVKFFGEFAKPNFPKV